VREVDTLRDEHTDSMAVPSGPELSVQHIVTRISELSPEATVVTGVGQHQMWAAQQMTFTRPHQLITSGGLGTMGFEVPAAMGAQAALPGQRVWSICGDGGFQMTLHELATLLDEQLPVKMAIMNNGFLGMVRQWQELFYADNYVSVSMSQPDFVKLAEAYGIKGLRVTDIESVDAAIKEANDHPGPVLVDFQVEAEGNVWPMVPAGASLAETIETPDEVTA
jgi:acetolactate synthase-1/2/3 large subunit